MAEFKILLGEQRGTLTYEEETGFCLGAEAMIDRAYEWMRNHQSEILDAIQHGWDSYSFYDSYRKSMEE